MVSKDDFNDKEKISSDDDINNDNDDLISKLLQTDSQQIEITCPITQRIMIDPVIIESGVTYERKAILRWFENGNTICPVKEEEIQDRELIIQNQNCLSLIKEFRKKIQ